MRQQQPLLLISLSLAALLSAVALAQLQVELQEDLKEAQTGTNVQFTVQITGEIFQIQWTYQVVTILGTWSVGSILLDTNTVFGDRITITATQLQIRDVQRNDEGTFTVTVHSPGSQQIVSKSAEMRVFDPIFGLSLSLPSQAVENRALTLNCTWTGGTEVTVQWDKDGSTLTADSRITISGRFVTINPSRRSDAGDYTCTASNPVSTQVVQKNLDVFYGPDTPVLTLEAPKDCVGEGDVEVGQTVRLTCASDSRPGAVFSWQRDGQSVDASPAGSGTLSLQTFSANQSGRYVCTARNDITGGTSEQSRDVAVVDVCFDGGEVAGIVIGAFLALLLLILLIILIIVLVRRRRVRQRNSFRISETNSQPRIRTPARQPNGVRDPDRARGPAPPLFSTQRAERLDAASRGSRAAPPSARLNGLNNSDTHRHNGRARTNGLPHNAAGNGDSYPHNGIDNRAFTHAEAQSVNTPANTQGQNPSVLIQPGAGQQPAVQLSFNPQQQGTQANSNNAQMPTINVNLNSYPPNSQPNQQDGSFPHTAPAAQFQNDLTQAAQTNLGAQSGQFPPDDARLIPTGHTHVSSHPVAQPNANTQTYQREPESHRRDDGTSRRREETPSSSRRRMPWDLLRGTPAYPNNQRDASDYSSNPPVREPRTPSRPQGQTASRSRTPPRRDEPPHGNIWSRLADLRRDNEAQLRASRHTQKSSGTQTENAQPDLRGLRGNQSAPRQEATGGSNPQAQSLMSRQASAGPAAASQRPAAQPQALTALQGVVDSRALADPNHLQQAHMAQQHRAAPLQTAPPGPGTQTQPVATGANQPRQRGTAPAQHQHPYPSAAAPAPQPNPSHLTQAALRAHTERAQVFTNRKHQTQAALLHPGPQTGAAAAPRDQQPPRPPPVIPLAQFQTLPKERTQHKSPTRGPQPLRPPVNIPTAQRPHHHHHHHHHHRPANGHGQPAHFAHQWQQQAHGGRPR